MLNKAGIASIKVLLLLKNSNYYTLMYGMQSLTGAKYIFTLIDDFSRVT